jgi:hypothetical protein
MVKISGSLSKKDGPRLAKQNEIWIDSSMKDKDCEILAEVLQKTTTLKTLALDDASGTLRNSKFIEALAKNRTIKTLRLARAWCDDEDAKALAVVLKENSTINNINLFENYIGAEGAVALAETVKGNATLNTMNLHSNEIGDEGAKAFADALKVNPSLQELNLGDNSISDVGAAAMAEALKDNNSLTKIELDYNDIGDEGAKALAEALKGNATLQTINLSLNDEIGDEGAAAMADALKQNNTLKRLFLSDNKIGEKGGNDILNALQHSGNSTIVSIDLILNFVKKETLIKIDEEIKRIQKPIKTVADDEGQVAAEEDLEGETRGDDDERSSNSTGQLTIHAVNAHVGESSNEDAQLSTERDGEIAVIETEIEGLQSIIVQQHGELTEKDMIIAEKDKLIAKKDGEIATMEAILKKIGVIVNSRDSDSNNEDGEAPRSRHCETESGDRSQREKELQSEIDSLQKQLKNSRPIETVDLTTNEVEPSTTADDDSNEEEHPSKRRRTKSNLAHAMEQSQQMVAVKEEAIQRATAAEANAETARLEKDAVEASLRDVQEDLEIQQETTEQVAVTLDTWQSRFDRVYELAAASGVDASVLRSIREGTRN